MSLLALLLDLANIIGGFLLAAILLRSLPRIGDDLRRGADRIAPFGWVIGIFALVLGIFHLIDNIAEGNVYHFELVGIGVGVALLWDRLTGRSRSRAVAPGGGPVASGPASGAALILAIFGLVAIIVGLQGLFTPDE